MTETNVKEYSLVDFLASTETITSLLDKDVIVEIRGENKDETGLQQK